MQAEGIDCSIEELEASVNKVIHATAQNNSSMSKICFIKERLETTSSLDT
ncbi:hypothetical protein OK016_13365 [Vibrio chagasii]|nr:hypothetical protein [Vibrio chagasii]